MIVRKSETAAIALKPSKYSEATSLLHIFNLTPMKISVFSHTILLNSMPNG